MARNWHIPRATRASFLSRFVDTEVERTEWTDKRLDDLKATADDGFRRMDQRFAQVDAKFENLQRLIVNSLIALSTMMFAGFGALITLFAMHF